MGMIYNSHTLRNVEIAYRTVSPILSFVWRVSNVARRGALLPRPNGGVKVRTWSTDAAKLLRRDEEGLVAVETNTRIWERRED